MKWCHSHMTLYLTEMRKDGNYVTGSVLFVSHTSSVDVKFTSDYYLTFPGFRLDVRSIDCADRDTLTLAIQHSISYGNKFCKPPQDVMVSTGEVLEDAITTETDSNGNYIKYTYERWNILTDENQVNKFKFYCSTQSWQLSYFCTTWNKLNRFNRWINYNAGSFDQLTVYIAYSQI